MKQTTLVLMANGATVTQDMIDDISNDFNLSESDLNDIAVGKVANDQALSNVLFEVCDYTHSHCDNSCPVYSMGGLEMDDDGCPDCSHFKNGESMLNFIKHGSIPTQTV